MINFAHAQPILPQVWHLPDFFSDPAGVRKSYREGNQSWTTQYPNRLLTPWNPTESINRTLQAAPEFIKKLTGYSVVPQVGYASMDVSGSRIMMHRLHTDIRAYIQVYMGEADSGELSSVFCNNAKVNQEHGQDYADISEFDSKDLTSLLFRPNHAWLMINDPRCFFGTQHAVAPNTVRETLCFHFAAELPSST